MKVAVVNTGPGWMGSSALTGEGVGVSMQFLDLDVREWASYGRIVDITVWRYAAVMQISDEAKR